MQTSERDEFEEQLAILCAGFNVPATAARKHAYFTGLAKMSLAQFARCVEHAISEEGPEDLPTTQGIWRLHRQPRRVAAAPAVVKRPEPEHLLFFANRLFLRHLVNRQGLGPEELSAARKAVLDTVQWFLQPVREADPDATPREFLTQFVASLQKVSPIDAKTFSGWNEMIDHPDALIPFTPSMARELSAA